MVSASRLRSPCPASGAGESAGLQGRALFVRSWPEISRLVGKCRGEHTTLLREGEA